jgi:nucleoside-diphosphate-sugar epimerase
VTGGAGFVGATLVRRLAGAGYRELGLRTTSKALIRQACAVLAAGYAGPTAFS